MTEPLPVDRPAEVTPHVSWSDRLKWAEDQGLKNLQEKFSTGDNMNKEAQTTLTYVLTAMGGTFAYVLKGLEEPLNPLVFGAACLMAFFTGLGIFLVGKTFFLGAFPSPYNQPQNLTMHPEMSLDDVRAGELLNIADRITEASKWNKKKAAAVNRVRQLLVVSPFVFIAAVVVYSWVH